jgi:hypothetical protein
VLISPLETYTIPSFKLLLFEGIFMAYELIDGEWWYYYNSGRTRAELRKCEQCGEDYPTHRKASRFCSKKCWRPTLVLPRGEDHYNWKGGLVTNKDGYVYVHKAKAKGLMFEDGKWWYRVGSDQRRIAAIDKVCEHCGKHFWAREKRNKFCSQKCNLSVNGDKFGKLDQHPKWNGGVRTNPKGYVEVFVGDIPGTTRKYKRRNRLVMEEILGRELLPTEHVHHINGDRSDDRPENLELWSKPHPTGVRAEDLFSSEDYYI